MKTFTKCSIEPISNGGYAMTKYNEIVEVFWYDNDIEIEQFIKVSITYPVFLKVQEDMKNGIYLYNNLKALQTRQHEKFMVYAQSVNKSLIEFAKELYEGNKKMGYPAHEIILECIGYTIEQVIYGNYKLLFLKSKQELILLNYVLKSTNVNPIQHHLIPWEIPYANIHIQNIVFHNKIYKTINTFNAFMSFVRLNNEVAKKELNQLIFQSFQRSIAGSETTMAAHRKITELDDAAVNSSCCDFKFNVVGNIIIISSYTSLREELASEVTITL